MVRKYHIRNVSLVAMSIAWPCGQAAEDLARGVITDARRGNCTICHEIPIGGIPSNAFGNLGPSLVGVGSRLKPAQIKARIVDPRQSFPDTVMPAYGTTVGLYRVQAAYRERPILSAAEIEAVVAYLSALK